MIEWILLIYGLINIGILGWYIHKIWNLDIYLPTIALLFFGIPMIITRAIYNVIQNIREIKNRKMYRKRYILK